MGDSYFKNGKKVDSKKLINRVLRKQLSRTVPMVTF